MTNKIMRALPAALTAAILIIQIQRVTDFGARVHAVPLSAAVFALVMGATIFAASYWRGLGEYIITASVEDKRAYSAQLRQAAKTKSLRQNASWLLVAAVLAEGGINLAETMASVPEKPENWILAGAYVYGAWPTLAAWGLGTLQALIASSLPEKSGENMIDKALAALVNRFTSERKPVAEIDNQVPAACRILSNDALVRYYLDNPAASQSQAAKAFGVSPQAISQRLANIASAGGYVYKRGRGLVKVG